MYAAFDFETYPIAPGLVHPPAVCMSFALLDDELTIVSEGVVTAAAGIKLLREWLVAGHTMVGANTAFDVWVSVNSAPDPLAMLALWVTAYESDRVTDVLLRQAIWDNADSYLRKKYSLDTVVNRHYVMPLDKANPWRVRFGELDGVDPAFYPPEAYAYSLEDARATAWAFIGQESRRRGGCKSFPGRDVLSPQWARARKALALADMSAWGMRADPESVAQFRAWATREMVAVREELLTEGIVRRDVKKHGPSVIAYAEDRGIELPTTPAGKPSLSKASLLATGDPSLVRLADWPACAGWALRAGFAREFSVNESAVRLLVVEAAGFSASNPDPSREQLEAAGVKLTDSGRVSIDGDACEQAARGAKDDNTARRLRAYARYSKLDKTLSSDIRLCERATEQPIHPWYVPFLSTGRTSTRPNCQNMARDPGMRECWVPPPGYLGIGADYSGVELHGFAQICYWVLGYSKLGDDLNAGEDAHLRLACAFEKVEYPTGKAPDAIALKAELKSTYKRARNMGKGFNFSRKGGGGAKAMQSACYNNYGVDITLEESEQLMALHDQLTPEFPAYSRFVGSFANRWGFGARHNIVHPYSGVCRRDCTYTEAHNNLFQGLAAALAGEALWETMKATRGLSHLGLADPLVGSRLSLFVHDSIRCDSPETKAVAAAVRLSEIMNECGRRVVPDCPPTAEPAISDCLSKLGDEPLLGESGELLAWRMAEQSRLARDTAIEAYALDGCAGAPVVDRIIKAGYPAFVAERVVV